MKLRLNDAKTWLWMTGIWLLISTSAAAETLVAGATYYDLSNTLSQVNKTPVAQPGVTAAANEEVNLLSFNNSDPNNPVVFWFPCAPVLLFWTRAKNILRGNPEPTSSGSPTITVSPTMQPSKPSAGMPGQEATPTPAPALTPTPAPALTPTPAPGLTPTPAPALTSTPTPKKQKSNDQSVIWYTDKNGHWKYRPVDRRNFKGPPLPASPPK